jgi:RNA polymerase sigma-70 factor (ECF subfamily)
VRAGDADAFADIVRAWSPMKLRVARTYVSTDASAQEVVQDAWLAIVRGLDRFEGRSSLRATDASHHPCARSRTGGVAE